MPASDSSSSFRCLKLLPLQPIQRYGSRNERVGSKRAPRPPLSTVSLTRALLASRWHSSHTYYLHLYKQSQLGPLHCSSPLRNSRRSPIWSSPITQAFNDDTEQHWPQSSGLAETTTNSPHQDALLLTSDHQSPAFTHFIDYLSIFIYLSRSPIVCLPAHHGRKPRSVS